MSSLNVLSGIVSSPNNYGSVYLEAYSGNTNISISDGATIQNTGSGSALYLFNENSPVFVVNNSGSILNDVGSSNKATIYNEDYNSNNLTVNNYGLIQNSDVAGAVLNSGNAGYYVVNNFSSGTLNGKIYGKFHLNNEGNINGDIIANRGESEVVNSGSIVGNIDFTSLVPSSFYLESAGSVVGNLTTSSYGDVINFNGGTFDGNVSLSEKATLNINVSYLSSGFVINGKFGNQGTVAISSGTSFTNSSDIGAIAAISNLNISGTLNTAANIYANNISLANTGVLNLSGATIEGQINGISANNGTINIASGSSFANSSAIGETNAISNLNISGTLITTENIYANNISLASTGVLNLSDSKTVVGKINGVLASEGTINVTLGSSFTNASAIGETNAISNLNISGTLNAAANISANDITLSGSLNLGNTAKTITGDIAGSGASSLNIGSASHIINGDLSLGAGDTLKVTVANSGVSAGKATISGATTIDNGVKLAVNLNDSSGYTYIKNGTKYTIIDAESGSTVNKINDSDINLNASGSNKSKILTFTTSVVGEDLFLDVERKSVTEITKNKAGQNVYSAINTIGESATGKLKSFQQYLDNATTTSEIETALKSVTPQADNGVILASVTVVNNSVKTVENRLDAVRNSAPRSSINNTVQTSTEKSNAIFIDSKSPSNTTPSYKLVPGISRSRNSAPINSSTPTKSVTPVYKLKTGISSGDKLQDSSVWAQTFGTSAKQGEVGNNDGYKSKALGFAFGYDKEIAKDTRLGISLSYANSTITSKDSLKKTDIDTYQINAYGGKSFGKYFLDSIFGFSWNEYSSSRIISSVSQTANSNYNGQSYVAKVRAGLNQDLGNGFNLAPEASLNYVRNNTGNYSENGADTLSLEVKGSSNNFLEARFGTTLSHKTVTNKGTEITPKISASYGYNFLSSNQTTSSNFVGQSVTFNTVSSKLDPKSLKLGAGIDIYDAESITLSADYIMERKQKYQSHSGVLKVKYDF